MNLFLSSIRLTTSAGLGLVERPNSYPKVMGIQSWSRDLSPETLELGSTWMIMKLKKVNERRVSDEWCHYLSKEAALAVNGTTQKKKLKDNLTLVKFFDLGVNLEGYWNFDQMAL